LNHQSNQKNEKNEKENFLPKINEIKSLKKDNKDEFKTYNINMVSFSNKNISLKNSLLKKRYKVKESILIKVNINIITISNKKEFNKFVEESQNNNKIHMFIFLLDGKDPQRFEHFFSDLPFESNFFLKEKTDFVFCFDFNDILQEQKQEFPCWIQKIQTIVDPENFHFFEDMLIEDKLQNLIQLKIEKKYDIFSIKFMALMNIQIGKLFLKRGFRLYFITLIFPPNFPYDEFDQRYYSKTTNFTNTLRIKKVHEICF